MRRAEDGRRRARGWRASYTVEAAILMSITFFVLGALLTGSFFLHDRAVLQAASCEMAAAGSNALTEKEGNAVISEMRRKLTAGRLMGSRNVSGQAAAGEKEVRVALSGQYPVPGLAMRYFARNRLSIQVSWSCGRIQPADTIRRIRGVGKLLQGGAG